MEGVGPKTAAALITQFGSIEAMLAAPEKIAKESGKRFVVCIDEFQNINEYEDSLGFQRKLRSHWQKHSSVCYCLYGSKRHMLLNIFNNYEMPFYKFGDILFLQKIKQEDWISFITSRFDDTGKHISREECQKIVELTNYELPLLILSRILKG